MEKNIFFPKEVEKSKRGLLLHPLLGNLLPLDTPRPVCATRHQNKIMPLTATCTGRYNLTAIPTMVAATIY